MMGFWFHWKYGGRIYSEPGALPAEGAPVALVLGAGVKNGKPSPVLYDRVLAAAELYRAGRVQKLLLSGKKWGNDYDEAAVMKETALEMGIPSEALLLDPLAFRTIDSCERAKKIFGIERAFLVTQRFHLYRSLYLCEKMGVEAFGFSADKRRYCWTSHVSWWFRESTASWKAWWEVNFSGRKGRPKEILPQ
ncbi:MAG: ElyC/SanA/YdcF family protein, partial [bacterium]